MVDVYGSGRRAAFVISIAQRGILNALHPGYAQVGEHLHKLYYCN